VEISRLMQPTSCELLASCCWGRFLTTQAATVLRAWERHGAGYCLRSA
jgi:hypothetical protein